MTVARNATLNIATQAVALVPAVLAMVIAHLLGPHDTGVYSFLAFLVLTAVTVSTLGAPSAITRFAALWRGAGRPAEAAALIRTLLLRSVLVSLCVGALLLLIAISGPLDQYGTARLALVACWTPMQVVVQTGAAGLAGLERFGSLLKATVASAAVTAAATISALVVRPTVTSLMLASTVAAAGSAALVLWPLRHELRPQQAGSTQVDRAAVRRYLVPLSAIVLLDGIVWQRSEVFFLGHYSTAREIAYYALVFTLVSRFATLLPGALGTVLLPRFTAQFGESGATRPQTYASGVRGTALLSLPLMCVGFVLARPVVTVLYGEAYAPAVQVLRILLLGGGLGAMAGVASAAIYGAGRQGFILRLSSVVAATNIALDILLIPRWAANGAAWANVTAQVISSVATFAYVGSRLGLRIPWADVARVAGTSAGAAAVSALWLIGDLHPVVQLVGGSATFAVLLLLLVVWGPALGDSDRTAIRELLHRRVGSGGA